LVEAEVAGLMEMGQPIDPMMIKDRTKTLIEAAYDASKKKAREEAKKAECKLDDLLVEGKFYRALAECLFDLTLFPFCVLKGPTVRMVPQVKWEKGKAITKTAPKMFWNRVSPFDIWWTPGVSEIEDAEICEKIRLTRADLNDLLGLPGYHEANIREILQTYPNGFTDWWDGTDSERAVHESRENPIWNQSGLIDCMEFHGNVQGSMLLEWGVKKDKVPDADRDYFVQAWLIGRYIIKVQIAPSPRKRHPYYVTSFEKVPGTPVGNGLPDILEDIQSVANAVLRALVNNLSIASGPQVMINDALFVNGTDGDELFPWKRWHFDLDPMNSAGSSSVKPIDFFQPSSNAQELMGLYEKLTQIADELSAIPRYITGSDRMGGAGRTASGLAMLMGNASKILQTVAANVDRDVMAPLLEGLYDMVMLTDEKGVLRGDETIRVRGVEVAVQRETNRQRQLEFLQITANPIDTQIMGVKGRATLLSEVSKTLGMTGVPIVPTPEDIDRMQQGALPMPGAPLTPGGNEAPPEAGGEGQQPEAPGSDNPGDQERKQSAGGNTMAPMAQGGQQPMPGQPPQRGPVAHFEQGGMVEPVAPPPPPPPPVIEVTVERQQLPRLDIVRDPVTNLILSIQPIMD
jgi:hypothetical protein